MCWNLIVEVCLPDIIIKEEEDKNGKEKNTHKT